MPANQKPPLRLPVAIPKQPDDTSCGIASLLGVYQYFGINTKFETLLSEVDLLHAGGTLSVNLGIHAIERSFAVELYSYNLQIFDPSWRNLSAPQLLAKLEAQEETKKDNTILCEASARYQKFLKLGGHIRFDHMTRDRIYDYLNRRLPMIVGLSSTFLYRCAREDPVTTDFDDIGGSPAGHFLVLSGFDSDRDKVYLCDPYDEHPFGQGIGYEVDAHHFYAAVYLGVVTYDANFLIIHPKS